MDTKVIAIYKETVRQLSKIYGESEAQSITNILFEDLLGVSKIARLTDPQIALSTKQLERYEKALPRLLNHEPIQHIAGHCYFYGRRFCVSKDTLIPRPETEELVDLIIRNQSSPGWKILDIGTGTGCIAISLALELKKPLVSAWDISDRALAIAQKNAKILGANVSFKNVNALHHSEGEKYDLIVSNPPYIPLRERREMHENVQRYEPGQALFVPDNDPLLFYRKIGEFGKTNLTEMGMTYFEIHEKYGTEVTEMLKKLGYREVKLYQDMQGKDRIVSGKLIP